MVSALCMLALVNIVTGCSGKTVGHSPEPKESGDGIYLYYANSEWSGYNPQKLDTDQLATAENLIDTVMTALLEDSSAVSAQSPVPHGMTYQRYAYDGTGNVSIIFTVDWEGTDTYQMVLCKAAFVKSLCQIDSVTSVTFELTDIVDAENVVVEDYTVDSYADMSGILQSDKEAVIYIPDATGQKLIKKSVVCDMSAAESIPEQLMEYLKATYEDAVSPFNDRTAVMNVNVGEGVCTVTLNEYFAQGKDGVDDEVAVYSIVDTLTALSGIDSVRFVLENTDSELGDINLEAPLTPNYTKLAD